MRVHVIEGGIVANTIEVASVESAAGLYPGATVIEATDGGPGWTWDGSALSAPPPPVMTAEEAERLRRAAYVAESDPLYMAWQAARDADAPDQDAKRLAWRAKRDEIQARYPYPEI
jgi:hypothetical protein